MPAANVADVSLARAANHFRTGRASRQLTDRWAHDPYLAGWTPARVLDALTQRDHRDRDRLVRGLVIRSQHHDDDATVILLAALRPGLWKLAHTYHRTHEETAFDDLVLNAIHVIARVNPTEDRLYDRILGRTRAATLRHRPDHHEVLVAEPNDRTRDCGIVDQIDARDKLRRLRQLRDSGAINTTVWDDVIAVRIHGRPTHEIARGRSPQHVRADLSRLTHRVERLLTA